MLGTITYILKIKSATHRGINAISEENNIFLECTFTFNFIQMPNIKPNIMINMPVKLKLLKFQIIFGTKKLVFRRNMNTKMKNKTKYLFKFSINLPIMGENKQRGIKAVRNHHCENAIVVLRPDLKTKILYASSFIYELEANIYVIKLIT
jgi:hypothetical protein